MKNNGQLPQVLIQNNHPGIVNREQFYEVQEEMKRRSAAKSPSAKSATGRTSYASKYALSERLVCGECGTLYRRCTWTIRGKKKIVWRCVNRLDHGTKYCKESPSLEETTLQDAIMAAINVSMDSKEKLAKGISDGMTQLLKSQDNLPLILDEVKRRIEELTAEFDGLFDMDGPEELNEERFAEITRELSELKKQQERITEQFRNNQIIPAKAQRMAMAAARMESHLTQWDESFIRQMVHAVEVISAKLIRMELTDGNVIVQSINCSKMLVRNCRS